MPCGAASLAIVKYLLRNAPIKGLFKRVIANLQRISRILINYFAKMFGTNVCLTLVAGAVVPSEGASPGGAAARDHSALLGQLCQVRQCGVAEEPRSSAQKLAWCSG